MALSRGQDSASRVKGCTASQGFACRGALRPWRLPTSLSQIRQPKPTRPLCKAAPSFHLKPASLSICTLSDLSRGSWSWAFNVINNGSGSTRKAHPLWGPKSERQVPTPQAAPDLQTSELETGILPCLRVSDTAAVLRICYHRIGTW